ncbi:MAG: hypothetical protein RBR40_03885 [Tenuifilaceae bacterium]|nr:hypothetical protein [Tenuifilaceae bacterium]
MTIQKHLYKVLTLLFIIASFGLKAQDAKSFYADSTGKLFVNPKTPVYLYISTSPDGANAVRVKSIQPEGNPMFWDGHGVHYLTHSNLYLGRKIRFDLFADGIPPKTSTSFSVKQGIQINEKIYLSGKAAIELSAIDKNSGVNKIFVSVNHDIYKPYSEPILFDKDGEYSIRFYAEDNVGNKEDETEQTIVIDTAPPKTELEIEGPSEKEVIASSTKFKLKATDQTGVRNTYYSIDNEKEKIYTRNISVEKLSEGEHILTWYSVDAVGNTEEKQTFPFFVDRTPPMVFEEIIGNTYMVAGKEYSSGRSQLRIVAVDNKAGVKEIFYSINGKPYQQYTKQIILADITGALTIKSYAVDNVDNKSTSDTRGQQFLMPEIDIIGPTLAHSFKGKTITLRDTLWISPETLILLKATDSGSGVNRIEYKMENTETILYSEPFTIPQQGFHKISYTAWDNVDNPNINSFEFGVDSSAPELFHHFSVKPHGQTTENGTQINIFSPSVHLYIAATDDIGGVDRIMVSINGQQERLYSQPLKGFKPNQTHEIKVTAFDTLGNKRTEVVRFRVE